MLPGPTDSPGKGHWLGGAVLEGTALGGQEDTYPGPFHVGWQGFLLGQLQKSRRAGAG